MSHLNVPLHKDILIHKELYQNILKQSQCHLLSHNKILSPSYHTHWKSLLRYKPVNRLISETSDYIELQKEGC